VSNLGPVETRKRMMFGAAMLTLGVAATAVVFFLHVRRGAWLLLLFIPFWLGTLGLLQGREST
jgi:hypothetical protein